MTHGLSPVQKVVAGRRHKDLLKRVKVLELQQERLWGHCVRLAALVEASAGGLDALGREVAGLRALLEEKSRGE